MPEDLDGALARLRPLLLDTATLVRAVAAGRRRNAVPSHHRAELRPVDLKGGRRLQVVTTDGRTPSTTNHAPEAAAVAVDALLAEPFGNWHVETAVEVVQLRVTKKGQAQVHATQARRPPVAAARHDRARNHLLDPADPLFDALGADADKRRQVDAFLRLLAPTLPALLDRARAAGRPLQVLDLGCGNAYLTFAAQRWMESVAAQGDRPVPVHTVGVDVRPDTVTRNTRLADQLGMPGLHFVAGTIAAAPLGRGEVDLALALHACDTATDEALALAVRREVPVVLAAPCCHHDLQRQLAAAPAAPHPYAGLARHGILRERFADVLTDTLRAQLLRLLGYRVEVVEFVASRHTPRNVLLRAHRTGARPDPALRAEYADLVSAWQLRPALAGMLAAEVDAALGRPAPAAEPAPVDQ